MKHVAGYALIGLGIIGFYLLGLYVGHEAGLSNGWDTGYSACITDIERAKSDESR